MLFDSHCHLTDPVFADDRGAVIDRAVAAGVGAMTTICSDAADLDRVLELTASRPEVWGTAGIHPHEAVHATPGALDRVRAVVRSHPRIRAIGECGLDYHYDHSPRDVQREVFRAQLHMAAELGRPVVVHCREADGDVAELIREFAGHAIGVLHCFTGSAELLATALDAGWYASFSGMVTFPRFAARDLLRSVPSDRLLIETDSPYLAPVPHRGKRNEPAFVARVGEKVADLLGTSVAEVAEACTENARRFYGLPSPSA